MKILLNNSFEEVSDTSQYKQNMKFDSEEVFSHVTIGHKPDSKPSVYDKDALNVTRLKTGNDVMKDNHNGVLLGFKANEAETDNGWTASELHCCMRAVDSTERVENDSKDILAPETHSCGKSKSFEDTALFMEKGVTDCDLPELQVCYRENSCHDVKDICVDEGVPLNEKFVFEDVANDKHTCPFVLPEKNPSIETIEEKLDIDTSNPFVLKSEADKDSNNDFANQFDRKDLMLKGRVKSGALADRGDEVSKEIFSLGDLFTRIDSSAEECNLKSIISDPREFTRQSIQISTEKANEASPIMVSSSDELDNDREMVNLVTPSLVSAVEKSENSGKEAKMGSPARVSDSEDSTSGCVAANDVSYNSKMETASTTSNFDSSKPTASSKEECPLKNDSEPFRTLNLSGIDDVSYDSKMETASTTFNFDSSKPTASNKEECPLKSDSEPFQTLNLSCIDDVKSRLVSRQAQDNYGETSFSGTGPLSGVITYSGPIAYSGSLSHRSDSSTTSTRSFAFPTLQSEWNSSPVRMAKADRRHLRKHGGWRQGLLCCRF